MCIYPAVTMWPKLLFQFRQNFVYGNFFRCEQFQQHQAGSDAGIPDHKDAGLDDTMDIIVYCRIGERSAHSWFVLHELLGYPQVQNYDGSWVEYGSLIGVPVEV